MNHISALSFIAIILSGSVLVAADVHVHDMATGANDGTSWTDAYTKFPADISRGDTVWLANTSSTLGVVLLDDAVAGETYIYVKKATPDAHGSSTGWLDTMGDGQVLVDAIFAETAYLDIDGVTGSMNPNGTIKAAFGIKVSTPSSSSDIQVTPTFSGAGSQHHIRFANVEFTESSDDNGDKTFIYILSADSAGKLDASNLLMDNCYLHFAVDPGSYYTVLSSCLDLCCHLGSHAETLVIYSTPAPDVDPSPDVDPAPDTAPEEL